LTFRFPRFTDRSKQTSEEEKRRREEEEMSGRKRQKTERDDGGDGDFFGGGFGDEGDDQQGENSSSLQPMGSDEGPTRIKNKMRRTQLYQDEKAKKKKEKKQRRLMRKKEAEILGDKAPPKLVPKTLENTREFDETIVNPDDQEVIEDEATDEFAQYFNGAPPKVLISTSDRPTHVRLLFVH